MSCAAPFRILLPLWARQSDTKGAAAVDSAQRRCVRTRDPYYCTILLRIANRIRYECESKLGEQ